MYIDYIEEIDKDILWLIENDARLSYSDIAEKVGISRVSVKNRIKALEEKGVIEGYKTIINPIGNPEGIKFFMEIETTPEKFLSVIDTLALFKVNRQIYSVSGECRIQVTGYANSASALKSYAEQIYRKLDGIKKFSLHQVLVTYKDVDGGVEYVKDREIQQDEGIVQ